MREWRKKYEQGARKRADKMSKLFKFISWLGRGKIARISKYSQNIRDTFHLQEGIKAASVLEDTDVLNGAKVIVENSIGTQKIFTVSRAERINEKMLIIEFEEITSVNEAKKLLESKYM